MPVSGKFVWASSSLFFFFPSFFPAWSVAMLHKWDLILLPWLQSFSGALKSKQQGCWRALYRKTQSCFRQPSNIWHHLPLLLWFWWVWGSRVLQSFYGRLLFLFGAEDTGVAKQLQGTQQFYLPSGVTSSSIVKATKRQGSTKEMREQPIAVWMHITGRGGNIALNSFANLCS